MIEITIWILVAISNGSNNIGISTVIDRFASREACESAMAQLYENKPTVGNSRWAYCIKATVAREGVATKK